jgi:hypothetical protein
MLSVQKNSLKPLAPQLLYCGLLSAFSPLTMPQSILESEAVIKLAWHLQENQKNYKIITPYDAQRVLIEDGMKETEGLRWEEKVTYLLFIIVEAQHTQGLQCRLIPRFVLSSLHFFFPQLIFHS